MQPSFIARAWWGKCLGAFFGFLIAGPIGAFFGIFVGNFFDKGLANHLLRKSALWRTGISIEAQHVFLKSLFHWLGYFSKLDGFVSEKNILHTKKIMFEMRLSSEEKKHAVLYFNEGKTKNFKIEPVLLTCQKTFYDKKACINLFLDIAFRYATTQPLSQKKIAGLNNLFKTFGFLPPFDTFYKEHRFHQEKTTTEKNHESFSHSLNRAYALLEVPPDANHATVKRAYRRLISQHHPDKATARGLSLADIKKANDKTHEIRKAYEYLRKINDW